MYDTSDFRKGLKVRIDGQPFVIVEHQFVKPGKGQAFTRTKLKNMISGSMLDRTYRSGEKLEKADLESRDMQYLYADGDGRVFMDNKTYDQVNITDKQLGNTAAFLLDGMTVEVLFFEGRAIDITPPTFVELKVTRTDPGFKGDTSGNTTKPATVETGLTVNVPLFVNEGDVLKIDTRTSDYVERVNRK